MEYLFNRINQNPKPMDILQSGNQDKSKNYNMEKLYYRNNGSSIKMHKSLQRQQRSNLFWTANLFSSRYNKPILSMCLCYCIINYSMAYDHVKISIPNNYICICPIELSRNYFSSSFTGSSRLVNRKYPSTSSRKPFRFVLHFTQKIKLGPKITVHPVARLP